MVNGPLLGQSSAVELATRGLRQMIAEHDLLWRLGGGQDRAAVTQEVVDVDGSPRSRYDKADDFLAVSVVGNADRGDLDNLRPLQQNAVDLERRDVDAATDYQILLAPCDMQVSVGVEKADVACKQAAATMDLDRSVIHEIAIVVVGKASHLDVPNVSRRQRMSAVVDDCELVVARRFADGADMPAGAAVGGNQADFAATIALSDGSSKALLETAPVLAQQRRRTRNHEPQACQCFGVRRIVAIKQHVDRGRIAGGNGRAMLRDVLEKSTTRELSSQDQ